MCDEIKLWCWVQDDEFDEDRVFEVWIKLSDTIFKLKQEIRRVKPSLEHIDPESLKLWKFEIPLASLNNDPTRFIKLEEGQRLISTKRISHFWGEEPAEDVLSVILPRPADTTITPSSSESTKLSLSPPLWLVDVHNKLWGKHDLYDQIFRTAKLTKTDFIEPQLRLHNHDPERNSESYVAKDVLAIKAEFLRPRSFADITAHFDAKCNGNLAPQLVFDTSDDVTPPVPSDPVDDDPVDAAAMDVDPDPNSSSHPYIDADAAYLSTGATAIFPCTIRYMDLTLLKLKHFPRAPQLMLLRNEWGNMVDIFNKRREGIRGSAIFTGQPGIGKTCLLYYILILCLIRAQPIVFQDMAGDVFLINDEVRCRNGRVDVPGDDVLTLVDADDKNCTPHPYLLDPGNLRILLTSSPRTRKDRSWLTQSVGETRAAYVMEPWSQGELLIASLFLAGVDITLERIQATTRIYGNNPRRCFDAAVSLATLSAATDEVLSAIKESQKLNDAVARAHAGQPIHRAFDIYPSSQSRHWESCLVQPISDWALSQIMAELDRQGADAAYNFYQNIQGSRDSAALGGKMFENKVHKFFRSIAEPRIFTICSLENRSTTFDIEFSSRMTHHTFGAGQRFAGQLTSSIAGRKSCYLRPLSPIFPTFDSFLYQHEFSQPSCQPLIGFQITAAHDHPISIKGLAAVQTCLTPNIPELKALRPAITAKWIILFVVPEPMMASFVQQRFKDAEKCAHWQQKTTQYVLGLPEEEVMRS